MVGFSLNLTAMIISLNNLGPPSLDQEPILYLALPPYDPGQWSRAWFRGALWFQVSQTHVALYAQTSESRNHDRSDQATRVSLHWTAQIVSMFWDFEPSAILTPTFLKDLLRYSNPAPRAPLEWTAPIISWLRVPRVFTTRPFDYFILQVSETLLLHHASFPYQQLGWHRDSATLLDVILHAIVWLQPPMTVDLLHLVDLRRWTLILLTRLMWIYIWPL